MVSWSWLSNVLLIQEGFLGGTSKPHPTSRMSLYELEKDAVPPGRQAQCSALVFVSVHSCPPGTDPDGFWVWSVSSIWVSSYLWFMNWPAVKYFIHFIFQYMNLVSVCFWCAKFLEHKSERESFKDSALMEVILWCGCQAINQYTKKWNYCRLCLLQARK